MARIDPWNIVPPMFVAFGIWLLWMGFAEARASWEVVSGGVMAEATVIGNHWGDRGVPSSSGLVGTTGRMSDQSRYHPIVRFQDEQGRKTEVVLPSHDDWTRYLPDDRVRVIYPDGEPHRARLDDFRALWKEALIWSGLGGTFFGVGSLCIFFFSPRIVRVAIGIPVTTTALAVAIALLVDAAGWRSRLTVNLRWNVSARLPSAPSQPSAPPPAEAAAAASAAAPAPEEQLCAGLPAKLLDRCKKAYAGADPCAGTPAQTLIECFYRNPDPGWPERCRQLPAGERADCSAQYEVAMACRNEPTLDAIGACFDRERTRRR